MKLSRLDGNKAILTWKPPENSNKNVTEYTIFFNYEGNIWMEIDTTEQSIIIPYEGQRLHAAVGSGPISGADIREYSKAVTFSLRKYIRI